MFGHLGCNATTIRKIKAKEIAVFFMEDAIYDKENDRFNPKTTKCLALTEAGTANNKHSKPIRSCMAQL